MSAVAAPPFKWSKKSFALANERFFIAIVVVFVFISGAVAVVVAVSVAFIVVRDVVEI